MKNRVELHAKTKYSLDHTSTLDIKNLILKCASNNEKGVAIVDTDSIISFHKGEKALKELNIKDFKLIYGVELNVKYLDKYYKVVVLLKNKKGLPILFQKISYYNTLKYISLNTLIRNREYFLLGLVYNNVIDSEIIKLFDYIEVSRNTKIETINKLKETSLVVYTNQINALSSDETLSKKIIYNKLNIKNEINNEVYKNTEETLKEINDKEIVIDNSNKIFDMIEDIKLLDDKFVMLSNNYYNIDLLVANKLKELYGTNIPKSIDKRVKEELKLIHEYNYDGFINIYKKIVDKCKDEYEEYVISDYTNYLYISYLLGITHFNPVKLGLNYEMFFMNKPYISITLSEYFSHVISNYLRKELNINLVKCKGLIKLTDEKINLEIKNYEIKNSIKLTDTEKDTIHKHLKDYPISNNAITKKELVLPEEYNLFNVSPRELLKSGSTHYRFTNIDYKDIEDRFMTIELHSSNKIDKLKELKELTNDNITNSNYKEKRILDNKELKEFLKPFEDSIILDDLYEDLINSNIELPDVFNIINEIKRDKNISNKIKEILDKNNIKIPKCEDLTFISRGILNELTRTEYELLYFKEYYPLAYYYIMLKDLLNDEIIEIIKKGREEVENKMIEYPKYTYEYNYLKLVNELYNSDIEFTIEQRYITEDYTFEYDKENNRIVLVLNKSNETLEKYLNNNISLIGTRPINGKMKYLSKLIYKLLEKNKDITLLGFGGNINFYLKYILKEITGIDIKVLNQYLNPCSIYKDKIFEVDSSAYIDGLKYLLYHDLNIKDYYTIDTSVIEGINSLQDKVVYISSESESNIVIIDNIELVKGDIEYLLKELNKISKEKNINFIIFTNLKKEYESSNIKDISSFENNKILEKYIDNISLLDKEEIYSIKEKEYINE